jgi:hypothetical protein
MNQRQAKKWANETVAEIIEQYLDSSDESFSDEMDQDRCYAALRSLALAHSIRAKRLGS